MTMEIILSIHQLIRLKSIDIINRTGVIDYLGADHNVIMMPMLEKRKNQIAIGVSRNDLNTLLVKIIFQENKNISNIRTLLRCRRKILNHGKLDVKIAKFKVMVVLWSEFQDFFQTKYNNPYARRIYKYSNYGNELCYSFRQMDLSKDAFPYEIKPKHTLNIDAVYTWVNHQDESWLLMYKKYNVKTIKSNNSNGLVRYFNRDEIYYSIKTLKTYAPWIKVIYIVTNCAPLQWMKDDPQIRIIDHSEIIDEKYLPTFNSHAIEASLHNIKELSKYFLYFNDDFFLCQKLSKSDFFTHTGLSKCNFEEYGMVHGDIHPDAPDYLNAARKGAELIAENFGFYPTALHRHSPYALRKDILSLIDSEFKGVLDKTRRNKFRSINDVSLTSFLYHYYAIGMGVAIESDLPCKIISSQINYQKIFSDLLEQDNYKTICINDGGDDCTLSNEWNTAVRDFLIRRFDEDKQL